MGYGSTNIAESQPMALGIHSDVEISEITALTTEPNKQAKTFDVLDIIFINKKGEDHKLRIFNPDSDTDPVRVAKNQENASNTVAYLASKVAGEDKALDGSEIKSWKDFTKAAIKLIGDTSGKLFQLKICGNVWNGKASLTLPNYRGWLESSQSSKTLAYTPSEMARNNEYKAFYAAPSSTGGAIALDGDDMPF
jgi:hypothetical protein